MSQASKHVEWCLNKAKKEIEEQIRDEWKKIGAENELVKYEKAINNYDRNFKHSVSMIIVSIKSNRLIDTHSWIDEAIKWEKRVQKTFHEMKSMEGKLDHFTRREIKAEKKEIKKVIKEKKEVKDDKKEVKKI